MTTTNTKASEVATTLGLSDKDVEQLNKQTDTYPTLIIPKAPENSLQPGTKIYCRFVDGKLKLVNVPVDEKNKEKDNGIRYVTAVDDINGLRSTFWITPKSIKAREFYRLSKQVTSKNDTLEKKWVIMYVKPYKDKSYGIVSALRIQLASEELTERLNSKMSSSIENLVDNETQDINSTEKTKKTDVQHQQDAKSFM